MSDLTISIGTVGNRVALEGCLRSVFANAGDAIDFSVWVVYNGYEPAVAARIAADFPQVRLLTFDRPLGYCSAHNVVLGRCESRFALLLDDDTLVPEGTLSHLVALLDAQPDIGIAGCKTLNADGSFQQTYGHVPSLSSELCNAFVPDAFWRLPRAAERPGPRDVGWLNGSFLFVRCAALRAVGPLDERYYTYVCEADWCERIRRAGWRVVYVPDVSIVHAGGKHSINNKDTVRSPANLVLYHVNRYYFFRKHYGPAALFLLRFVMAVGLVLRLARYALLYGLRPGRREAARVKLIAFWESLKLSFLRRPDTLPARLIAAQES